MVSYNISNLLPATAKSLLLLLTLLLATPHTTKITSCTPSSARNTRANVLRTTLYAINSALTIAAQRPLGLDGVAVLVFSAPLSTVDALLGHSVANRLCKAALAHLARDEVVDAVLEVVDLGYACYFGPIEVLCGGVRLNWKEDKSWLGME